MVRHSATAEIPGRHARRDQSGHDRGRMEQADGPQQLADSGDHPHTDHDACQRSRRTGPTRQEPSAEHAGTGTGRTERGDGQEHTEQVATQGHDDT